MNISKTIALTLAIGLSSVVVAMEQIPSGSELIVRPATADDRSTLIAMITGIQKELKATGQEHHFNFNKMAAEKIADLHMSEDWYLINLHGSVAQYKSLIACNENDQTIYHGVMLYQIINGRRFSIPTGISANMSLVVIPQDPAASDVANHRRVTTIRNAFQAVMEKDVEKIKAE